MKKLSLIFSVLVSLFVYSSAKAQAPADYFAGKWNVIIAGTPNGDAKMILALERKDGKLTGTVRDTTGAEISKITNIEEKGKAITAYFNAQNYDVSLMLEPVDADHVKGSLLSMFTATGVRVKEKQ